jgi:hypothetical protein
MVAIGRIVHFVVAEGVHCAAIITNDAHQTSPDEESRQALTIFQPGGKLSHAIARYDPNGTTGTWHYPEGLVNNGEG